jgi:hypothetical protein
MQVLLFLAPLPLYFPVGPVSGLSQTAGAGHELTNQPFHWLPVSIIKETSLDSLYG